MNASSPLIYATVAGLLAAFSTSSSAQIAYLQLQPDGSQRLRQMNADGSGDVVISLPFTRMEYPTWSRDGAQLAITALDPSKPLAKTQNVFAISAANGSLTQLTRYQDFLDDISSTMNYTLATHKAFSPDRSRLATFSLQVFGGGGGGLNTFPSLEIHSNAANSLLLGNESSSAQYHGGEGVDWAPNRNVLVTPLQSSAPNMSGGGTSGVTAIFFVEPSQGALVQGRVQQITFPRADLNIGAGETWSEHDYQPKISPNGIGLAYVRSFQLQTLQDLTSPTPGQQSLRIRNLNTGGDTEVFRFNRGFYVSSIAWSPDGAQLAFDIGVQATNGIGMLIQKARPETNQIYVVNIDGTGLRQLRGNGNSSPAWGPRVQTGTPPAHFETESLAVRAKSGATHTIIRDAKLSRGAGTLASNTTVGSFVTYSVPVAQAGTYNVKVRVKTGSNRGKFQLTIGTLKHGLVQDEYSPSASYQVRDLGPVTFASGGVKSFRFTVTGKNVSSAGTSLAFDALDLVPQ